ncbi:MAG: hypothetical protein ACLGIF_07065 [Actinomycetes bacterium]
MLTIVRRIALFLGVAAILALIAARPAAAAPLPASGSAAVPVRAAGEFTANVDFASLATREVGQACEFTVRGALTFTGTLSGVATGTTTALIFAPCATASTNPPGTFADVFRFASTVRGTVDGVPVVGDLAYAGVTREGGGIEATITLRADRARAVLRAAATVAVGGTYAGVAQAG